MSYSNWYGQNGLQDQDAVFHDPVSHTNYPGFITNESAVDILSYK